jgi:hypothetical protein
MQDANILIAAAGRGERFYTSHIVVCGRFVWSSDPHEEGRKARLAARRAARRLNLRLINE